MDQIIQDIKNLEGYIKWADYDVLEQELKTATPDQIQAIKQLVSDIENLTVYYRLPE